MHDVLKGVWGAVVAVGLVVAAFGWLFAEDVTYVTWMLRVAGPLCVAIGFYCFVRLEMKKDEVPDFLSSHFGDFFEIDGLCFSPLIATEHGQAYLVIYYQNRYLGHSKANIIVEPKVKGMDCVSFSFNCSPAEFGLVHFPIAIPIPAQGRVFDFVVEASVKYPEGRGKTVRFQIGFDVGGGIATVARIRKARAKLTLPTDVSAQPPEQARVKQQTLWSWGDPREAHAALPFA